MLDDGTCLSNAIYIVEAPNLDAFKQRIVNVAPGIDLSDAVNMQQLSNAVSNVQVPTDLSSFTNSPGYTTNNELSSKLNLSAVAEPWQEGPYNIGAVVSYNGKIWRSSSIND